MKNNGDMIKVMSLDARIYKNKDIVPAKAYDRVRWERDIAIGQLNELGYSLGEKIRPCDKGCGGCHYNDGEPHAECVVCNKYVAKEESTLDEVIATIKKQEKWLKQAGYNEYNVSVAFGAIKHILRKRGE